MDDAYFLNIVEYRLTTLRSNQLESYPLAVEHIQKVLTLLDENIGR